MAEDPVPYFTLPSNALKSLFDEIRISGGGARSDLWKRIVLDAVGHTGTYVPDHPGSSLGAAVVAAQAVGLSRDWEGLRSYLRRGIAIPFSTENHRIYCRYFEL